MKISIVIVKKGKNIGALKFVFEVNPKNDEGSKLVGVAACY